MKTLLKYILSVCMVIFVCIVTMPEQAWNCEAVENKGANSQEVFFKF